MSNTIQHAQATDVVSTDDAKLRDATARLFLDVAMHTSGLTLTRFASDVLARDRRTVQRWRSGFSPIPEPVYRRLLTLFCESAPSATRR